MIATKEDIKDWIRVGYDQGHQHLFILKDEGGASYRPYWVRAGDNVEVVRTMILECGEKIIKELNLEVKLFLYLGIK